MAKSAEAVRRSAAATGGPGRVRMPVVATFAKPRARLPETRLRVSEPLSWPRYRPAAADVADSIRENSQLYDETTSGSIYVLSRDPAVATTRSPHWYVAGNPLNATDPSGLIDQSQLSQSQIDQTNQECSTWQNESRRRHSHDGHAARWGRHCCPSGGAAAAETASQALRSIRRTA
jgi:hypothetical protein